VTELADKHNVLRPRQRSTEIRIFKAKAGETPMLYERGLPVVATGIDWHVDIGQKVPLSVERDNVTPAYLKAVCVLVVNEMSDYITPKNANEPWVRMALEHPDITKDATLAIVEARFGKNRNSYDPNDIGSNKEAVSKGKTVVHGGSMSKAEWANVKKHEAIVPAGKEHPTNPDGLAPKVTVPPAKYNNDQERFVTLIEDVSPILINHTVTVRVIDDTDVKFRGCTQWKKGCFLFTINLAHQDTSDWADNYRLLIHELAHQAVQSNDHLCTEFYEAVTSIGAALSALALDQPEMFTDTEFDAAGVAELAEAEVAA
jgi:hypothetical protein